MPVRGLDLDDVPLPPAERAGSNTLRELQLAQKAALAKNDYERVLFLMECERKLMEPPKPLVIEVPPEPKYCACDEFRRVKSGVGTLNTCACGETLLRHTPAAITKWFRSTSRRAF